MENKMQLPNDEIMRQMAKLALEQATTFFAAQARDFAKNINATGATAEEALMAFATTIEKTNADIWPVNKKEQQ